MHVTYIIVWVKIIKSLINILSLENHLVPSMKHYHRTDNRTGDAIYRNRTKMFFTLNNVWFQFYWKTVIRSCLNTLLCIYLLKNSDISLFLGSKATLRSGVLYVLDTVDPFIYGRTTATAFLFVKFWQHAAAVRQVGICSWLYLEDLLLLRFTVSAH